MGHKDIRRTEQAHLLRPRPWMEIGGPEFRRFADLIRLQRIEVFGRISEAVLNRLHQKTQMLGSGTVSVDRLEAGFARL